MQKVSIKRLAEICGVSDTAIRKLVHSSKLPSEKDLKGNYYLDLDDEIIKEYITKHNQFDAEVIEVSSEVNQPKNQPNDIVMIELVNKIEYLSKLAGKAELLTDNLITKDQDVKYWQEKFFELQNLYNQTNQSNITLQTKVSELEKENEKLKQKSFFGLKFGK
ncbi:MAG: hypothetical protein WCG23_13000 [bacterium]